LQERLLFVVVIVVVVVVVADEVFKHEQDCKYLLNNSKEGK
jgi:hypothetical protein